MKVQMFKIYDLEYLLFNVNLLFKIPYSILPTLIILKLIRNYKNKSISCVFF